MALSANSGFALPMAVTLCSLIKSTGTSTHLKIYLVGNDIHPDLSRVVNEWAEVTLIPLPKSGLNLPARFSPEALAPVFLDQLLEEERVLFLDSDLLVLDDVLKIWETGLEGHTFAAVQDIAQPWNEDGTPYFNCGVLLLDLAKFRSEKGGERVLKHFRENPSRFLHQNAFNILYKGAWKKLNPRWNLIAGLCGRRFTPLELPGLRNAMDDPGIAHFAGRFKPWRFKTKGCFAAEYETWLQSRPFGFERSESSAKERLLSFYDMYLRDQIYPLERYFWGREWI